MTAGRLTRRVNPLGSIRLSSSPMSFDEWKQLWEGETKKDLPNAHYLISLLHLGFDCPEDTCGSFRDRLLFYSLLAQGHAYAHICLDESVKHYRYESDNASGLRGELARKAWTVLCAKFFDIPESESTEGTSRESDWLEHVRDKEVLSGILSLFSEGGFSSWWHDEERIKNHHFRIAKKFFQALLKIVWTSEMLGFKPQRYPKDSELRKYKELGDWARLTTLPMILMGGKAGFIIPGTTTTWSTKPIITPEVLELLKRCAIEGERVIRPRASEPDVGSVEEALHHGSRFQYHAALAYILLSTWLKEDERQQEIKRLERAAAETADALGRAKIRT